MVTDAAAVRQPETATSDLLGVGALLLFSFRNSKYKKGQATGASGGTENKVNPRSGCRGMLEHPGMHRLESTWGLEESPESRGSPR